VKNSCPWCNELINRRFVKTATDEKGLKGFLSSEIYLICPECSGKIEMNKNTGESKWLVLSFLPCLLILPLVFVFNSKVLIFVSFGSSVVAMIYIYNVVLRDVPRYIKHEKAL